jgi:hypothetical protein
MTNTNLHFACVVVGFSATKVLCQFASGFTIVSLEEVVHLIETMKGFILP